MAARGEPRTYHLTLRCPGRFWGHALPTQGLFAAAYLHAFFLDAEPAGD